MSSLLPDSPASRKPAKKQPSRISAASNWNSCVPTFRRRMDTTCRATTWHFALDLVCRRTTASYSRTRDVGCTSVTKELSGGGLATRRCLSASRMTLSLRRCISQNMSRTLPRRGRTAFEDKYLVQTIIQVSDEPTRLMNSTNLPAIDESVDILRLDEAVRPELSQLIELLPAPIQSIPGVMKFFLVNFVALPGSRPSQCGVHLPAHRRNPNRDGRVSECECVIRGRPRIITQWGKGRFKR